MKWDQSEILFQKMYSNSGDKIYIGLFVDQKKICLKQKGNWKAKRTCSPEAGLAWGLAESWKNVSRSCLSLSVLLHFFLNSLLRQEVYRLAHRKPKSRMKETRFLSLTLPTYSRLSSDHSKMKGPLRAQSGKQPFQGIGWRKEDFTSLRIAGERETDTKPVQLNLGQGSSCSFRENPVVLQMWAPVEPWKGT